MSENNSIPQNPGSDFETLLASLEISEEDFFMLGLDDPDTLEGLIEHTYGKGMLRHLTPAEDLEDEQAAYTGDEDGQ